MNSLKLAGTTRTPGTARRPELAFEVLDPNHSEGLWRSFQDEGVCSPYQRCDWVRSYAAALATEEGFDLRILVLRDEDDRPLLLLPLGLRRRGGVAVASFVGGRQANFNLPITAPGLSTVVAFSELKRLLVEAGRAMGADAFVFQNQPLSWRGEPNPLSGFGGSASANEGFKLSLSADPGDTIARAFSGETRKKMRKKTRLLGELGPVALRQARDATEVDAILGVFFQQKERRFRELGIDNPFAGPMQSFIRQGSLAGLDDGRPAIELYALSAGERIVATFGGTGDGWRLCGMFNSFDSGDDVTKFSPGELLLAELIKRQCELGRQVFDLGIGKAAYKTALCDEIEDLIDVFVPVTARGRLYAMTIDRLVASKRLIKQTPWALRAANGLRTLKAAVSG